MNKQYDATDRQAFGSRRTTKAGAAITAFVLASAMVLAPGAASAQNNNDDTNGAATSVIAGTGFPTEDTLQLQAEGRLGNSASSSPLSGDWELGIGTNTQSPDTSNMEQYAWKSNQTQAFTVEYDGASTATMTVGDTSTEFEVGEIDDEADLYVIGKRSPGFIVVNNLALNGEAIDESISPGATDTDGDHIKVSGPNLSEGFTLTGDARFTFASIPSIAPSGSDIAFQVQVRGDDAAETPEEDTTGPVINEFSIENISTLSGDVNVRANVTDDSGVENVRLEILVIDGFASVPTGIEKELTPGEDAIFTTSFDTRELEEGKTYTANLIATDASENANESREVSTFFVDNANEEVPEENPNAPVIAGDFDVEVREDEKIVLKPEVTSENRGRLAFDWQVSDDNLLRDNTRLDRKNLRLQPSAAGDFTATLMVTDRDGNEAEATYNITVTPNQNDDDDDGNNNGNDGNQGGNNGNNQPRNWFVDLRGSVNNFFINIYNTFNFWS